MAESRKGSIIARGIWKSFPFDGNKLVVLPGIDFQCNQGEMVSLMGPSGSGKTTLLYLLSGLDRVDAGSVVIADYEITSMNERALTTFRAHNLGFIFQSFNLVPTLTCVENVGLPLMITGHSKRESLSRALELLDQLDIRDRANLYPAKISGGEKQRISVARAIIHQPNIVLCDEPTGNLDRENSENIMSLLRRLNKELHQTFIIVTHDRHVGNVCDRIISMVELKKAAIDRSEEVASLEG